MALVNRISRLLKADFHAVLDNIEEPELLLKQSIREMEENLAKVALQRDDAQQRIDRFNIRKEEIEHILADLDTELDICFESDEQKLAHDSVRKKLQTQRLQKQINKQIDATQKSLAAAQKTYEEQKHSLDSVRQKAELLIHRDALKETYSTDNLAGHSPELMISDSEVEVAYLREKKQRDAS